MDQDAQIRALTTDQHGAVSLAQLRAGGFTNKAIAWRVGQGTLERLTPRVFVLGGSPDTRGRRASVAVLDAGPSALSHHTAADWWGLPGFRATQLSVTRLRGGRVSATHLATVHEPRLLADHHLTRLDGVPTTTPARTLFDLAGRCHPLRVERALDTALAKRIVSPRALAAMLDDLGCRGRAGIQLMRSLLDARGEGYKPPESGLERRFDAVIREGGLPPMRPQVELGGEEWLGRIDFVDATLPLAVQIDSERYHSALIDAEADARQTQALEDAGFTVLRFSDVDVWHRPQHVVDEVRRARMALLRLRSAS